MSRGRCNPPIDALGKLDGDKGNPGPHEFEEPFVEVLAHLFPGRPPLSLCRGVFRASMPLPATTGLGSGCSDDHSSRLCGNDTLDAGRRLSVMGARFKVNIDGRTLDRFRGIMDGVDLGVVATESLMVSLSDNPAFLYNDAAHHGVGTYPCLSRRARRRARFM